MQYLQLQIFADYGSKLIFDQAKITTLSNPLDMSDHTHAFFCPLFTANFRHFLHQPPKT